MGITIKCKFVIIPVELDTVSIPEETLNRFRNIGIPFEEEVLKAVTFHIELRERPEIIRKLVHRIFGGGEIWEIHDISIYGVTLYVLPDRGEFEFDGYIFIPMENIIAIHTIGNEDIKKLSISDEGLEESLDNKGSIEERENAS